MKRFNFFFRQLLKELELDDAFDAVELADMAIVGDLLPTGVISGLSVAQASPTPNLTVSIASGKAYDVDGNRIVVPSTQPLDISVDSNGVSTAVGSGGNAKCISVFLQFTRALSDPKTDGNSATVYYVEDASFSFVVRQGLEAVSGSEVAPALEADKVLLADIKRTFGQTQIINSNINSYATNRRQDALVATGGLLEWRAGKISEVLSTLRSAMNDAVITPTAITGSQNDYNPTDFATATHVLQNLTGASVFTGLTARKAGTRVRLFNIATSAFNLTLNHQDAASAAANRIICPNLANLAIRPGGGVDLWYDGTATRWRVAAP